MLANCAEWRARSVSLMAWIRTRTAALIQARRPLRFQNNLHGFALNGIRREVEGWEFPKRVVSGAVRKVRHQGPVPPEPKWGCALDQVWSRQMGFQPTINLSRIQGVLPNETSERVWRLGRAGNCSKKQAPTWPWYSVRTGTAVFRRDPSIADKGRRAWLREPQR